MKGYKLFFLFFFFILGYIVFRQETTRKEADEHTKLYMQVYVERIENTVNRSIEAGLLLESVIRYLESAFNEKTYNYIAGDMFDEETMISISYMPKGVVRWIYPPTEDNNNVLGLNVFEYEPTSEGAYQSKRSGDFMISGPFKLQSGEMGLTVRTPIYTVDNIFWGFVSIVYDSIAIAYEALEVKSIENLGYKYAIHSSYNGQKIPLLESKNFDYRIALHSTLKIVDNEWDFYLYRAEQHTERLQLFFTALSEAIGICSLLYLMILVLRKKQEAMQAQILLDPLTKLFNRKKLDAFVLKEKEWKNKPFTVFYLDLNKFKPVNDTYGHLIGDKLLIAFASRLMHRFDSDTTKIRVGGDEFVLLVEADLDDNKIKQVKSRLIELAEEDFLIDELKINISTSVGYACYPKDSSSITEVLEKADSMMYEEKQKRKNNR